jgi:hypothetical protein
MMENVNYYFFVYDAWDFYNHASSKFEFVDLYSYFSTQRKYLKNILSSIGIINLKVSSFTLKCICCIILLFDPIRTLRLSVLESRH